MKKKVISVYGYGRFGKLWADILAADYHVKVYSRRGLKPEEVSKGIEITDIAGLYDCDAIFYSVAISSFEEVLRETAHLMKKDTLFFDTCSVKVYPVEWMKKYVPAGSQIIATHPMFGPDSYAAGKKLPLVMCNINAENSVFDEWKNYFANKMMQIVEMTADEHDRQVAYSQGVTHYIGRVLADLNLKSISINTLGYSKLLEIIEQTCNDSWQLFLDLQKFNPYTSQMRDELHRSIEKVYGLFSGDRKEE